MLRVQDTTGTGSAKQLGRHDDEMTDDEFWLREVCRVFDTCGAEGQSS